MASTRPEQKFSEEQLDKSRKSLMNNTMSFYIENLFNGIEQELSTLDESKLKNVTDAAGKIISILETGSMAKQESSIRYYIAGHEISMQMEFAKKLHELDIQIHADLLSSLKEHSSGESFFKPILFVNKMLRQKKDDMLKKISSSADKKETGDDGLRSLSDSLDKAIPMITLTEDKLSDEKSIGNLMLKIIKPSRDAFIRDIDTIIESKSNLPLSLDKTNKLFEIVKKNANFISVHISALMRILWKYYEVRTGSYYSHTLHRYIAQSSAFDHEKFLKINKDLNSSDNLSLTEKIELIRQANRIYNELYEHYVENYNKHYVEMYNQRAIWSRDAPLIPLNKEPPFLPSINPKSLNATIIYLADAIREKLVSKSLSVVTERALAYLNEQITRYFETPIDSVDVNSVIKELMFRLAFVQVHGKKEDPSFNSHLNALEKGIVHSDKSTITINAVELTKVILDPSYVAAKEYMDQGQFVKNQSGTFVDQSVESDYKLDVQPIKLNRLDAKISSHIKEANDFLAAIDKSKEPEKDAMIYLLRDALIAYRDKPTAESKQALIVSIFYVDNLFPKQEGFGLFLKKSGPRRKYSRSLTTDLESDLEYKKIIQARVNLPYIKPTYKIVYDTAERHIFFCDLLKKCTTMLSGLSIEKSQQAVEARAILELMSKMIKQRNPAIEPDTIEHLAICIRYGNKLLEADKNKSKFVQDFEQLKIAFCEQYPGIWRSYSRMPSKQLVSMPFYRDMLYPALRKVYQATLSLQLQDTYARDYTKARSAISDIPAEQICHLMDITKTVQESKSVEAALSRGDSFKDICFEKAGALQQYIVLHSLAEEKDKILPQQDSTTASGSAEIFYKTSNALFLLACYIKHHSLHRLYPIDMSRLLVSYIDPILAAPHTEFHVSLDYNNSKEVDAFISLLKDYSDDKAAKFISMISYEKEIAECQSSMARLAGVEERLDEHKQANKNLVLFQEKAKLNAKKIEFFKGLLSPSSPRALDALRDSVQSIVRYEKRIELLDVVMLHNEQVAAQTKEKDLSPALSSTPRLK